MSVLPDGPWSRVAEHMWPQDALWLAACSRASRDGVLAARGLAIRRRAAHRAFVERLEACVDAWTLRVGVVAGCVAVLRWPGPGWTLLPWLLLTTTAGVVVAPPWPASVAQRQKPRSVERLALASSAMVAALAAVAALSPALALLLLVGGAALRLARGTPVLDLAAAALLVGTWTVFDGAGPVFGAAALGAVLLCSPPDALALAAWWVRRGSGSGCP